MMKTTEAASGGYDCIRLENQLCFPLYACAKEIVRQYRIPLTRLNLTYTQYVVMMVLWEKEHLSERELGKMVMLDSGTLAPLLKRLEKQGLITRMRAQGDERRLVISLTEKGRTLREKAMEVPDAVRGCINLSEAEQAQLKTLLNKALSNMNADYGMPQAD